MKAVKAIYENGNVKLSESPSEKGPVEVLVVFPEMGNDPWDLILNDSSPRPALAKWIEEVKQEIAIGKATPLNIDDL